MNFIKELLCLIAQYDLYNDIVWTQKLDFYARANDLFVWACTDAVPITPQTLPLLKQCCTLCRFSGLALFCCRMRAMRPQPHYYDFLEEDEKPFFDACGPARKR